MLGNNWISVNYYYCFPLTAFCLGTTCNVFSFPQPTCQCRHSPKSWKRANQYNLSVHEKCQSVNLIFPENKALWLYANTQMSIRDKQCFLFLLFPFYFFFFLESEGGKKLLSDADQWAYGIKLSEKSKIILYCKSCPLFSTALKAFPKQHLNPTEVQTAYVNS